jgi:hypothetical protein
MKPIGARVRLRLNSCAGPMPRRGDALRTPTGRTYKVIAVKGMTLVCRVVQPDAKIRGTEYWFRWAPRRSRTRGRAPIL